MNTILARILWFVGAHVVAVVAGGIVGVVVGIYHVNNNIPVVVEDYNLLFSLAGVGGFMIASIPYMHHLRRDWTHIFYMLIPFAWIYFLFSSRRMTLAEQAANKTADQSEIEYQKREKPSAYTHNPVRSSPRIPTPKPSTVAAYVQAPRAVRLADIA